jgi:RNA polymerase sigma-70 factor (ECF subfamily)
MEGYTTHVSLLERLAKGPSVDAGSWNDFCDRYGGLIRGYARRRGLQPSDCDDVVQDVLLSLTNALPKFQYDPAKGRFRAYLFTVVSHAVQRNWCQKQAPGSLEDGAASFISDGCDADEQWETEWRQHHLRQAMKTIAAEFNAADRSAFERYAIDGRSVHDTAESLGLTVDQVYQAKSRILRRLSAVIHDQVHDEG